MTREQVLDKVKKLLALGNLDTNNSEEEAKAAMLKAQKLLKEYDLSIEEVDEQQANEYATEVCEHKYDSGYRIPLSQILSKNFRCMNFLTGKKITFMGHPVDVKICKETFEYAYSFIFKKSWQEYNRKYALGQTTKGVVNSYAYGFIDGLKEALDQQCTALMLVVPEDVKSEFEKMSEDWKTKKATKSEVNDLETYLEGKKDGKEFMSQKKVEKKEPVGEDGTSHLPLEPDPIIKPKKKAEKKPTTKKRPEKKEYAVGMTLTTPKGVEEFVEYFEVRYPSEAEKRAYSRYKGQELVVNWVESAEEYRKNIA